MDQLDNKCIPVWPLLEIIWDLIEVGIYRIALTLSTVLTVASVD